MKSYKEPRYITDAKKVFRIVCGGINWTWYVDYTYEHNGVRILSHYRRHNCRDFHPPVMGLYGETIEGDNRVIIALRIGDGKNPSEILPVVNPAFTFAYGESPVISTRKDRTLTDWLSKELVS